MSMGSTMLRGNLESRRGLNGVDETFDYDDLDRLTDVALNGSNALAIGYASSGNINSKSDVGTYDYGDGGHAVKQVSDDVNTISDDPQVITYTPFNSVETIMEGAFDAAFTYGPDDQRRYMVITQGGVPYQERYYIGGGLYERDFYNGNWREMAYINTPTDQEAVYISEEGSGNYDLHLLTRDYLGSILQVSDETGNVLEEYSFDPWGNRRDPQSWQNNYNPGQNNNLFIGIISRGFTGHEHLDCFGLINMNGRLYDRLLGRMLSPDNFVPDATSTQGYNRYSYVFNNPLRYTDPSGENPLVAVVVGVSVSVTANTTVNLINGDDWHNNIGTAIIQGAFGEYSTYTGNLGLGISTKTLILKTALNVASSYLPSYSVDLGDGVTLGVSPSVFWGREGWGVGANASVSVRNGNSFLGMAAGTTYGRSEYTCVKGFTSRISAAIGYSDGKNIAGLASNAFYGGGIPSQTTGSMFYKNLEGLSLSYENDGKPFGKWRLGDDGDSYRTAAVTMGYKDLSIGMRIFTGYRDMSKAGDPRPADGYPYGKVENEGIDSYLSGILYIGMGGFRVGLNSSEVGYKFQNKLAHSPHRVGPVTLLQGQNWIPWCENSFQTMYGGYFSNNPYTNW